VTALNFKLFRSCWGRRWCWE